jgi:hypothetical protein
MKRYLRKAWAVFGKVFRQLAERFRGAASTSATTHTALNQCVF